MARIKVGKGYADLGADAIILTGVSNTKTTLLTIDNTRILAGTHCVEVLAVITANTSGAAINISHEVSTDGINYSNVYIADLPVASAGGAVKTITTSTGTFRRQYILAIGALAGAVAAIFPYHRWCVTEANQNGAVGIVQVLSAMGV